jgi:hypothetical protein
MAPDGEFQPAFLDAVGKSMRQISQAVGSNVVDPKLLTYAEKLHY